MSTPTDDEVRLYAFQAWSQLAGFLVAGTMYAGMQLGLYQAMAGAGPLDSTALADRIGLHERWIREWLRTQSAAGLLTHVGDERFELPAAGAAVLADPDSLFYAGGVFAHLPFRAERIVDLPDSFRTGLGHSYDEGGPVAAAATESLFRNWYRHMLVPVMLPSLDGVVDVLASGGRAADVGCGAGIALVEMAKAWPEADLHGYEVSPNAIDRARENAAAAGVQNVTWHLVPEETLPDDGTLDLVMTLDCVHDMTHPDEVLSALRPALADDGVWLWAEPKSFPTFEQNVANNPMAALMYATSITACMSSAMAAPDGAGLGTLGIPESKAREMAAGAGFGRFEVRDFGSPVNIYFEVRP